MEYVLIVVMSLLGGISKTKTDMEISTQQIKGFTAKEHCVSAGNQLKKDLSEKHSPVAVCRNTVGARRVHVIVTPKHLPKKT